MRDGVSMLSVMFVESNKVPVQYVVCPKCGRQVRIDEDCECEMLFIVRNKP